jgi:hypothetical protein
MTPFDLRKLEVVFGWCRIEVLIGPGSTLIGKHGRSPADPKPPPLVFI